MVGLDLSEHKWGINSMLLPVFERLFFIFCHIVCTLLNFQLLAKMLILKFIECAWK